MGHPDEDTKREIIAFHEDLEKALLGPDLDWLARNLAPDSMFVHLDGRVESREELVERLRSGAVIYVGRRTRDLAIRQYSDTAVVTGRSEIDSVVNGTERHVDTRFTRVYVKNQGTWVFASHQAGPNAADVVRQ